MLLTIFIAAALADQAERQAFTKHLLPIAKAKGWDVYQQVVAGDETAKTLTKQSHEADLVIALLSVDFIESSFCSEIAKIAVERHQSGKNVTAAVLLRHCPWQYSEFSKVTVLPFDHVTIAESKEGNDTWYSKVMSGIQVLMTVAELRAENQALRQENFMLSQYFEAKDE